MSKIIPSPSKYSLRLLLLVLQAMETMLYTIDHINANAREAILPAGVSVGAHVLDDCDTDTYGLEQAVDFIKGRTRRKSNLLSYFLNYVLPLQTLECLFSSRASGRVAANSPFR